MKFIGQTNGRKILLRLFWDFFRISLFVVGGGYAIIAVADAHFARKRWTREGELMNALPVFQMIPGLIATHTAVYVGRKLAGIAGAVVSVIAIALPAIGVFLFLTSVYDSLPLHNRLVSGIFIGLRAALTGIIAATVAKSWRRNLKSIFDYMVFAVALAALCLNWTNVATVLAVAMATGIIREWMPHRHAVKCSAILPMLLFLKYGLLAFGGGFVIVPMYMESFVGAAAPYLNITAEEFSNVMALSQMTPGPVGVNCATFFGYRIGGIAGALMASALLLVPGSILVGLALISLERFRTNRWVIGILAGVRPASIALMSVALLSFARISCASAVGIAMTAIAFIAVLSRRIGIMTVIAASAASGLLLNLITG